MATKLIGCRLPTGLTIRHPKMHDKTVTLKGLNKKIIIGAQYVTTEVDATFWDDFVKANLKSKVLMTGAIFEIAKRDDEKAVSAEMCKVGTGFEPMRQDAGGIMKA